MKSRIAKYFAVVFLGLITTMGLQAQNDVDDYKLVFKFNTIKQADNTRLFEVSFIAQNKEDRKDKVPIFGADIVFLNVSDTIDAELGVAKTNQEGVAQLTMPADHPYLFDEEGVMNFKASFKGSDGLASKSKRLKVQDIFLDMEFEIVDSTYTVMVSAYYLDSIQEKVAVEEVDLILSVGGLISEMPIAEETLEDGSYEFEFPDNIPGDKDGMINVFVTIDDDNDFGTAFQMKTIDWGTFDDIVEVKSNQLWSEAAPIWMYIVLSFLLIGVWANYFYSIFNLMKIKKEGKEFEANSKE